MSDQLFFVTTFGEELPVTLVQEKYVKEGRSGYLNVVVDRCPICGQSHEYLADICTFDRRECEGKPFITLNEKDSEYVLRLNSRFFRKEQAATQPAANAGEEQS